MADSGSNRHQCVTPRDDTLAYVGSWQPGVVCTCGSALQSTRGSQSRQSPTRAQYNYAGDRGQGPAGIYEPMAEYLRNNSDQSIVRISGLSGAYRDSRSHRQKAP
ncbi:hypothetical protein SAMD00023353_0602100 [Rosellinia necatrix]|uniref:Uncharacterized protein n=1 Tax=Rosellinia necatrix TaxID=77044 RepID=A0A1S8A6U4_ROSNE|nr:hypothetical protein SAMD00023353_0602100 [Rosellinia necatrix]